MIDTHQKLRLNKLTMKNQVENGLGDIYYSRHDWHLQLFLPSIGYATWPGVKLSGTGTELKVA